jgi:hypothetical protein
MEIRACTYDESKMPSHFKLVPDGEPDPFLLDVTGCMLNKQFVENLDWKVRKKRLYQLPCDSRYSIFLTC